MSKHCIDDVVKSGLAANSLLFFITKLAASLEKYMAFRFLAMLTIVFVPLITKTIVDQKVANQDLLGLCLLVGLNLFLLVLHVIFAVICVRQLSVGVPPIIQSLRKFIFSKIQRLEFGYLDSIQEGKILAKYAFDTQKIEMTLIPVLHDIVPSLSQAAILIIGIGFIDYRLALFTLMGIPVLVFVRKLFFEQVQKNNHQTRLAEAAMTGQVSEYISALRLIRGFGQEQEVIQSMEKTSSEYARSREGQIVSNQTMNIAFYTSYQTITILSIGLCAWFTLRDTLSFGSFIGFVGALPMILWPINIASMFSQQYLLGRESFISIKELLESNSLEKWKGTKRPKLTGHLSLENVSFRYDGADSLSINTVNLEILPQQHVAIVGQSGAGKSSLINLILGLYQTTDGQIKVDGCPQDQLDMRYFRRHCAIVMQENILISGTIRENLKFGSEDASDQAVERAARLAQADEFIVEFEDGYETMVGERGLTLSGGQRQRIAIARALLREPKILIFDEATSALDYESEAKIKLALQEISKNRTVITIAHRLSTIRDADVVVVLDQGKIVQQGTYDELRSQSGRFMKMIEAS